MADPNTIVVDAPVVTYGNRRRMVWVSPTVGYFFYIEDVTTIPKYKKTTTGPAGLAAATPVTIAAAQGGTNDAGMVTIWDSEYFDGAGNIHIIYGSITDDKIYHKSLALDTDTLSSEHTVHTQGASLNPASPTGWDGTVTSNGDIYFVFKSSANSSDNKLYRSQDVGATWSAMGGTVPAPSTTIYPNRVLLPWTLWDGSTEDVVMVMQDSQSDDLVVYVYDVSTTTWSAGTSVGRDGEYIWTATGGMSIDAVRLVSNGHLYVIGQYYSTDKGVSLNEVSSTGQGNVTITSRPDMVPDTEPNDSYYGAGIALCVAQSTGMMYGFFFADMTFTTAGERDAQMKPYTIATNLWGTRVLWSDRVGDEEMERHFCQNRSIPASKGGQICPVFFNNENSPEEWTINEGNSIEVAAGGGGNGGEDTPGVPILDPTFVQGIVTIA